MEYTTAVSENLSIDDFDKVYDAYRDYMRLKNFSIATVKTYLSNYLRYIDWCIAEEINQPFNQDLVRSYLIYRVENGAKWQTMNNIYSAMRKLFREVLYLEWSTKKLSRPRRERILPELISQFEIQRLILSCKHLKHRAILVTLYATGVRAGELCNIKLSDIDGDRLQIRIRKGKGGKDRYVQVPVELILFLRQYYLKCRPEIYLFNGRKKGAPMSVTSLRWPIREARRKLGILKPISPHTLRHCYATHHLESGTDLVFIKQNLGHKHLKTTARYIHLCKERYQHIQHPIVNMTSVLNLPTMA